MILLYSKVFATGLHHTKEQELTMGTGCNCTVPVSSAICHPALMLLGRVGTVFISVSDEEMETHLFTSPRSHLVNGVGIHSSSWLQSRESSSHTRNPQTHSCSFVS